MVHSHWKKYLSYLVEIPIQSTYSTFNPVLNVSLKNGRYRLSTKNAVYSYEDKYDNFKRAFKQVDWTKIEGKKVLILGLGLGSVIQLLEIIHPDYYEYVAIELDEAVTMLAQKYILANYDFPLQVIHTDAAIYLETCQEKFDIICMDIFEDDVIPAVFQEFKFLMDVKRCLSRQGLLFYNCLAYTKEDRKLSKLFFESKFLKTFSRGKLLDVKGNYILINHTDSLRNS